MTSHRAKIIKLHGDFLYDTIKNTIRETDALEKNMQSKFMQFSREYGLIVIGYGGNDRSIMDILDSMIKPSEAEQYFPNGIYWCLLKGTKPSRKLDRLLQRDKAYLVEIEGFEEFMAELHEYLGLTLPDSVRDPYKATTERLNRFVPREALDQTKKEQLHPIIKKHVKELNEQIQQFEKAITGKIPEEQIAHLIPYTMLISYYLKESKYDEVIRYSNKAMEQEPNNIAIVGSVSFAYNALGKFKESLQTSEDGLKKSPTNTALILLKVNSLAHLGRIKESIDFVQKRLSGGALADTDKVSLYTSLSNQFLIDQNWQSALSSAENAIKLSKQAFPAIGNKCIALRKLGQKDQAKEILVQTLPLVKDEYMRACYFASLEEKDKMLDSLKRAVNADLQNQTSAKLDPDFEEYREDPDFRKIVYS